MKYEEFKPPFHLMSLYWSDECAEPKIGDSFLVDQVTGYARHAKSGEHATNTVFDVISEVYSERLDGGKKTTVYKVLCRIQVETTG